MTLRSLFAAASVAAIFILFAATTRYTYPDAVREVAPLTARHVADPGYSGTTLRFEGRVNSVRTLPSGIVLLRLYNPAEDVYLESSVFPSLGCLPLKPQRGELVRITGNLGAYQGRPQLRPLSADHVEVVASTPDADVQPLSAALEGEAGDVMLLGPVTPANVEFFTSRAGRRHLRLNFTHAAATVPGVMFEGDWTDCEVRRLRSGRPVVLAAELDEYQGELSLIVRRVAPHLPP